MTGNSNSPALSFGGITLSQPATSFSTFVARMSPAGTWDWAQASNNSGVAEMVADNSGHLYLAGAFSGATVIFSNTTLTNADPYTSDVYVARLNAASGAWLGALRAGGTGDDRVNALLLESPDRLTVAVALSSSNADFGPQVVAGGGILPTGALGRVALGGALSAQAGAGSRPTDALQVYPTAATDGLLRYAYSGPLPPGAVLEVVALHGAVLRRSPAAARGALRVSELATGWYALRLRAPGLHHAARFFRP